jgi:hypothetical protein
VEVKVGPRFVHIVEDNATFRKTDLGLPGETVSPPSNELRIHLSMGGSGLLSMFLSARCGGRDLAARRAIDRAVYDLRVEIAEAATKLADQIERADRFIEQVLAAITATVVDPASLCADAQRGGLQRIAATPDAVPFMKMCNLANLDKADARRADADHRGAFARGRRRSCSRLCRRDGVPRRVRDHHREGAQAAAAMRGLIYGLGHWRCAMWRMSNTEVVIYMG